MATTKVTFTLDAPALASLNDAAERLSLPKSEIVREAILEFHARIGRLSERERIDMLRALDELMTQVSSRPQADVEHELAEIRSARRTGGRRSISPEA